ncbi:MAG: DUF4160 domain-containing protein [Parachlamydiaceae bacterium]
MPEISRFLGIVIKMFYKDHPPSHFHVEYGEYRGCFSIEDMHLISGNLPNRVVGLVTEWALLHKNELREDWRLLTEEKPLKKITPLV